MEEKFQLLRRDYQGFFPRLSLYVRIIKSGFALSFREEKCARLMSCYRIVVSHLTFKLLHGEGKNQINQAKRRGNPIHSRVYRETSRTAINNYRVKRVKWISSDRCKPRSTTSNLSRKIAWKLILVYNNIVGCKIHATRRMKNDNFWFGIFFFHQWKFSQLHFRKSF